MFTGLVEATGRVSAVQPQQQGLRLVVQVPEAWGLAVGDSLAVDGLCLTVAGIEDAHPAFDVVAESLRRSNLGDLEVGDRVNLERALKVGDRLGGHLMSGHIDCTAKVVAFDRQPEVALSLALDGDWGRFLFAKGSVALNGVSLTLASVDSPGSGQRVFRVCLVPTTLEITALGDLKVGDRVNVETDQIARYAVETIERMRPNA